MSTEEQKQKKREYHRNYYHKHKVLQDANLERDNNGRFKNKNKIILPEKEIIDLYVNGNSTNILSKKYNVDKTIIRRILIKNKIKLRSLKDIAKTKEGSGSIRFNGHMEISGMTWCGIKNAAKSRKLEFSITIEYIWNLFIKQNRKCALSGIDIKLAKNTKEKTCGIQTASLDRIDSSKGYVEGNVQWVHKDINRMKQDFNEDYFLELCRKVIIYHEC